MINHKKIKKLCKSILTNLECDLDNGKPCKTCTFGIIRDIENLQDEIKEENLI